GSHDVGVSHKSAVTAFNCRHTEARIRLDGDEVRVAMLDQLALDRNRCTASVGWRANQLVSFTLEQGRNGCVLRDVEVRAWVIGLVVAPAVERVTDIVYSRDGLSGGVVGDDLRIWPQDRAAFAS